NIPHVIGSTRKSLIQRRLGQLYRDTPFHHAGAQGREKEGRKDDRMLFSALTNAELLKPWLAAILKEKVPLAGIYSVPLLSVLLCKKLHLSAGSVLLVSHQSSGLRQSYFHDGQLRFSRLTQLSEQDLDDMAETANTEMAKTRQFLVSTRQMQRDQHVQIVVLAAGDILQRLQTRSPDTPTLAHHFIAPGEASSLSGLRNVPESTLCDALFLTLLARSTTSPHYQLPEHQRLYTLWQTRAALYVLSAATIAAGLLWTGANVIDILDTSGKLHQLEQSTQALEQRYQALIQSMPKTVANPKEMKTAVDLADMITQNAPSPEALLVQISRALDTLPQIKIKQLHWQASETEPVNDPTGAAPPPPADAPPAAALVGVPNKPVEILTIEGEVIPFKDDYRSALASVNQLALELGKNKQLKIEITRPPLDVRPTVNLKGQAGNNDEAMQARFELTLVWKP
ncbi:MAG: hypothetical protein JSS58_02060, partial [Proteobacteria bacterium]|nr:hypothetical protein [Pseudomonadota bacterium]